MLCINWSNGAVCLRIQQAEVENNVRMQIGLWLRQNVKPGETVYLEPLGYIGFFSRAHVLDYPGLVSPRSVAAVKATTGDFAAVAERLDPDWLVLRPLEKDVLFARAGMADRYELVTVCDRRKNIAGYGPFEGRHYAFSDATFFIYHRRPR